MGRRRPRRAKEKALKITLKFNKSKASRKRLIELAEVLLKPKEKQKRI